KLVWSWIFRRLRRSGERRLRAAGVLFSERVYGLLATGRMTEAYVLGLLPRIRANFAELYFHPAVAMAGEPLNGPPGSGSAELAALVSARVRDALDASGFALTSHRDSRGARHCRFRPTLPAGSPSHPPRRGRAPSPSRRGCTCAAP